MPDNQWISLRYEILRAFASLRAIFLCRSTKEFSQANCLTYKLTNSSVPHRLGSS